MWDPPFREDSFGNTSSLGEDSGGEEAVSWESGEGPRTTTCGEQAGDSKADRGIVSGESFSQ